MCGGIERLIEGERMSEADNELRRREREVFENNHNLVGMKVYILEKWCGPSKSTNSKRKNNKEYLG
jgi:hypothetical protein